MPLEYLIRVQQYVLLYSSSRATLVHPQHSLPSLEDRPKTLCVSFELRRGRYSTVQKTKRALYISLSTKYINDRQETKTAHWHATIGARVVRDRVPMGIMGYEEYPTLDQTGRKQLERYEYMPSDKFSSLASCRPSHSDAYGVQKSCGKMKL